MEWIIYNNDVIVLVNFRLHNIVLRAKLLGITK